MAILSMFAHIVQYKQTDYDFRTHSYYRSVGYGAFCVCFRLDAER